MLSLPRSHERVETAHRGLESSARLALHCAQCDRCGGLILGTRFMCTSRECSDFDLCETCNRRQLGRKWAPHRREHVVVALRRPLSLDAKAASPRSDPRIAALIEWIDVWRSGTEAVFTESAPEAYTTVAVCTGCGSAVTARDSCEACINHAAVSVAASPRQRQSLLAAASHAVRLAPAPPLWRSEAEAAAVPAVVEEDELAPAPEAERGAARHLPVLTPLVLATHLCDVLAVENICFAEPYSAAVFEQLLGLRVHGVVAERAVLSADAAPRVEGYVLFDARGAERGAEHDAERDAECGAERDAAGEVAAEYGGAASIISICVRPDCRGRGVASALLAAALEGARRAGARAVRLHVHDDNRGAQRLYARFGFEVEGRERAYYRSPPGDALRMVLLLP